MYMLQRIVTSIALLALPVLVWAQRGGGGNFNANSRFEQLGANLPTPNTYRTAAGTPGKDYFQNTASYDI
jgi:hypothetical protein